MVAGMSAKNSMLSPAVQDLGLGDQLRQQQQDQEEEMKKRSARIAQQGGMSMAPMSMASTMLLGG